LVNLIQEVHHKNLLEIFWFTTAIRHFFANTVHSIQDILRARIHDNFEAIRHNPVQLSS